MKPDAKTKLHGFCISHDSIYVKNRFFFHKNKETIEDWVKLLRIQSCNMSFEDKYSKGKALGKGKFSTVFQCQNIETQELIATKQIIKGTLTENEKDFLREEI